MEIPTRKPLRLWPGIVIVVLQLLLRFVVPIFAPDTLIYGVLGGFVAAFAIILWWLFFSRAPWAERVSAIALMIVGLLATWPFIDKSIATGAQGLLFLLLEIPALAVAFVIWAVSTSRAPDIVRRTTMVLTILLACGVWALVRTGGFTAATFRSDLHWRWTQTSEERLVAQTAQEPGAQRAASTPTTQPQAKPEPVSLPAPGAIAKVSEKRVAIGSKSERAVPAAQPEWPGFRGPHRDDVIHGVRLNTDWNASHPVALWRRPIGPGWSSFAVQGDLIYTQEQRGPDEVVACYKLSTGEPVWTHRDAARFWESNGGPGPRGTPTLRDSRVYTFGATGVLNVLDASDGTVVWTRNAATDTGMPTPQWGFASSPLVTDDLVVVATSGQLIAYDRATGTRRWMGPSRGTSYSSPHLGTIDGVAQVLLVSEPGIVSVSLADGTLLWEHGWKGYPIVQPALTGDGDVLFAVSDSSGTRRLGVTHGAGGWNVTERWTSMGLKPYFNDFVINKGYAFGFDGSILACIDLKDGQRKWKGGRYGGGQMVLLADDDVLLVVSEEGELALVSATPEKYSELARIPAIEGKTWNHPVIAKDILLIRNGEEMAAFRLPLAAEAKTGDR
jgi:outer membrane protein assembly factor BamB